MSDSNGFIIFIIFLLVSILITFLIVRSQKNQIRQSLEKKGAKNIKVSWWPIDFDKSNHTYSVDYEDSSGKKHSTTCKVHVLGSSIYWENED